MTIWVLTVLLITSDPPKVFKTEIFNTEEECTEWINFYSEYPLVPSCIKVNADD